MTQVDSASGLLIGARQVPSPNCDERPDSAGIDLIVIHGISCSGRYGALD